MLRFFFFLGNKKNEYYYYTFFLFEARVNVTRWLKVHKNHDEVTITRTGRECDEGRKNAILIDKWKSGKSVGGKVVIAHRRLQSNWYLPEPGGWPPSCQDFLCVWKMETRGNINDDDAGKKRGQRQ